MTALTIGTRVRVTRGEYAKREGQVIAGKVIEGQAIACPGFPWRDHRRVQLDPLPDGAVERAPLIPEDELRAISPAPRPGPGFGQLSLFDLEVA